MSNNLVANTMLEAERNVKKSERMESYSYAWIQTADGSIQEVEREVAMLCPTIVHEMKLGLGSSRNNPISLPPRVEPSCLSLVIKYCKFHLGCRSYQEHKTFDEDFLQMDARSLFELLYLASYLQLGRLLNSTKEAMAQKFSNKSAEEIWHMVKLADDLPEEEMSKLREYSKYDSRMRLRKKYYTKMKMSAVKIIEDLKDFVIGVKPRQHEDTREVDDLLSFINGGDEDTKGVKTSKKKKNCKKQEQKKTSSSSASSSTKASTSKKITEKHDEDINTSNSANHSGSSSDTVQLLGTRDESFYIEEDAFDYDLDPALKEKIDREVEEFARLLNLDPDTIV